MLGAEITTRVNGRVVSVEKMAAARAPDPDVLEYRAAEAALHAGARAAVARKVPAGLEAGCDGERIRPVMPPTGPVRPGGYDILLPELYFEGSAPAVSFSPIPGGFRLRTRR